MAETDEAVEKVAQAMLKVRRTLGVCHLALPGIKTPMPCTTGGCSCSAANHDIARAAIQALSRPSAQERDGIANLRAILAEQPHQNSVLTVIEIETILENKGGFMPDEAADWFWEWRALSPDTTAG